MLARHGEIFLGIKINYWILFLEASWAFSTLRDSSLLTTQFRFDFLLFAFVHLSTDEVVRKQKWTFKADANFTFIQQQERFCCNLIRQSTNTRVNFRSKLLQLSEAFVSALPIRVYFQLFWLASDSQNGNEENSCKQLHLLDCCKFLYCRAHWINANTTRLNHPWHWTLFFIQSILHKTTAATL